MSPEAIGQYQILSLIGSGGMGDVFLAEDARLGRRVAIKRVRADVLDPQAHRRLLTEARATARLDHPNICGIHEVGEDEHGPFIVMPFVQGETLAARLGRGPLSIDEVLATAAQVADALGAAHAEGILHRDIKPANIMIDTRGLVRVMDFGLAKFTAPPTTTEQTATALTDLGSTLGTAAYMSPEQARGRPTDERSDLFSLGAVVHEMTTGQRTFAGPTIADTIVSVLGHHPPPLTRERADAPVELERIVEKLLKKNREERYQSAADLLVDLRALVKRDPPARPPAAEAPSSRRAPITAIAAIGIVVLLGVAGSAWWWRNRPPASVPAAAPPITSLAVLPLANVSPDPGQEYFVAALTDELSRALSGITSLRVTSRTSTTQFKDTKLSMPQIAAALGVDGLIEGSVVRDGDHVRINAKLVHGPSERTLWANAYDGELRGVLDLQRRVAEAIAVEVRATITPDEQQSLRATRTINPAAMELYLKGKESLFRGNSTPAGFVPEALLGALETFNEALKLEPDWAELHSGIAAAQHWLASGGLDPHVRFPASRAAAERAIRLDDRQADAHGALAYVAFSYFWDLTLAEREYERAIALGAGPTHSVGYSRLLQSLGRFDEAGRAMEQAVTRNPLSAVFRWERAQFSLMARRYDEAIARAADIPASGANTRHLVTGQALLLQGHTQQAVAELEQGTSIAFLAVALARAGRVAEARARLAEFEKRAQPGADQVTLAAIYVSLGDRRRALDALDRAFAEKALWLPVINVNPWLDDLRSEPRFRSLLQRLGFPASR